MLIWYLQLAYDDRHRLAIGSDDIGTKDEK